MSSVLLMHCASNSKVITAVAVLKMLLESSKVSLSTPMYKYLPKLWEIHPDVRKITIEDLLGYRSGLKNIRPTNGYNLKKLVSQKPEGSRGVFDYKNVDYALFRFILPGLAGYKGLAVASMGDALYGQKFRDMIIEQIFRPLGIKNAHLKMPTPLKKKEMLAYGSWNSLAQGVGSNDNLESAGSTGWFLTCRDLALFYGHFWYSDILLPEWLREKTFDDVLAYNKVGKSAGIVFASKGGRSGNYRSRVVGFKNGVSMVVYTNNTRPSGRASAETIIKEEFKQWYETTERRFTVQIPESERANG
jgi:CubicO group peptidase (beta-lactamase class C family)